MTPTNDKAPAIGNKTEAEQKAAANAPTVLTLSNGDKVEVFKGKGKHAMKAMEESDGKPKEYLPCLMKQLVLINGQPIVPEDLEELPLGDFTEIQAAFAEANFTSTPKK